MSRILLPHRTARTARKSSPSEARLSIRRAAATAVHYLVEGLENRRLLSASAQYLGADTVTEGSWKGVYGTDGAVVVADSSSVPSYATLTPSGNSAWTWSAGTYDTRALQKAASSTDRIAATWHNSTGFDLGVNLTDGQTHQVSLYVLDWDQGGRSETITVSDANTSAVLDTETVSSFSNGEYLRWNITGDVNIHVAQVTGNNAVVSGVFFDPVATPASAQFVTTDTTTLGNWQALYGTDGSILAGGPSNAPSYATVNMSGANSYTWDYTPTDLRALQDPSSSSGRIAAAWWNNTAMDINVNITDGQTHEVGLYVLDWDKLGRAETITVSDAANGTVLDTESVSGFANGQYLFWNVSGHVNIHIASTTSVNAVVSGVFFDPQSTAGATQWVNIGSPVTPDISSNAVSGFGNQAAGVYRVVYVGGIMDYSVGIQGWRVNAYPGGTGYTGDYGFKIAQDGATDINAPGTSIESSSPTTLPDAAGVPFIHSAGDIGVYLHDSPYYDNTGTAEGFSTPAFQLQAQETITLHDYGNNSAILASPITGTSTHTLHGWLQVKGGKLPTHMSLQISQGNGQTGTASPSFPNGSNVPDGDGILDFNILFQTAGTCTLKVIDLDNNVEVDYTVIIR